MPTKPHTNPENGYSLRIGKHLPPEAANLAYIHTDTPAPEKNLLVMDLARDIPENRERASETRTGLYTEEWEGRTCLFLSGAPYAAISDSLLLTSQYTTDGTEAPLYYIAATQYPLDVRNTTVRTYASGRRAGERVPYDGRDTTQLYLYEGNRIQVTKSGGDSLSNDEHIKLLLVPTGNAGEAMLYVLSNFSGAAAPGYEVTYPAREAGKGWSQTETLNPRPISYPADQFDRQAYVPAVMVPYELATQSDGTYRVFLPNVPAGASKRVDFTSRPPHAFQYQILADVETRFSQRNPAKLNIGLLYVNENIHSAIPLTASLRKLVHESGYFPDYVTFQNPHRQSGENLAASTGYWLATLQMPKEHYLDYDILILAGYGQKDLSPYAENLRAFLDGGGTLLVDNNGTGTGVLDFHSENGEQTFLADIAFSKDETASGQILYGSHSFSERYFPKENSLPIGVARPSFQFLNQESPNDWQPLLQFEGGTPALALKKTGSTGKLLVSNLGLMQDVLFGKMETLRLLTNLFLTLQEHRTFRTPVFREQVLHRDDLFAEEYQTADGQIRYRDDQSDQDSTQLVAKKQLAANVAGLANRYLPYAYQRPLSAHYRVEVQDGGSVKLTNPGFEATSEQDRFTDTTLSALPGYRYVVLSKGARAEASLTSLRKSGRQALSLQMEGSRAFFEQEQTDLPAGDYQFRAAVRTESVTGGGISVYDGEGNLLAASEPLSGTHDWRTLTLAFTLLEAGTVYLRVGASEQIVSGTFVFDDLELESQGVVRMTPPGDGTSPLYAYALRSRGQNFFLTEGLGKEAVSLVSEHILEPTIHIRSFVYDWDPDRQQYQKRYGKSNSVKVAVSQREGEKVVGRLLDYIPGKEAGHQWRHDQNVFYEINLDPLQPESAYLNLTLYDPSTQTHFHAPSGEWVLNREDLWWNGSDSTVQLRIRSVADALQLAGARFTLSYPNDRLLAVLPPATRDERDRWYLRIQKGGFQRTHVSAKDVRDLNETGRSDYYDTFLAGSHRYALPEYDRQSFYPLPGQRLIQEEAATYLDRQTIQVAQTPLFLEERLLTAPLYNFSGDGQTFQALDAFWDATQPVKVFVSGQRVLEGYEVDFRSGRILFDSPFGTEADVRAEHAQKNLRVRRRRLANARVEKERLVRVDDTTLQLAKRDVAVAPHPQFYRDGQSIHPGEYWVDYERGLLHFYQANRKNITADYSYYIEEELDHVDVNRYTGEIKLKRSIHFRDEILVDYRYEEHTLEYKGFRDPDSGIFQHLDLNPTAGHTHTVRMYDEAGRFLRFQEEASERLLNREVFVYLLPVFSRYLDRTEEEEHPARHCFGEAEWRKVKAAHPEALLIGRIQVRENTDIEQAVVMDARRPGGGLKEHITQEQIERRVGYTSAFWDIGGYDGLAYYQNGVTVVRLPERVLKANGGPFEESGIRDILSRYLAFGVYPLLEFVPEGGEA